MSRLTALEIFYLTDEAKSRIVFLLSNGVQDFDLAVEMAIEQLGDEIAFELEAV